MHTGYERLTPEEMADVKPDLMATEEGVVIFIGDHR